MKIENKLIVTNTKNFESANCEICYVDGMSYEKNEKEIMDFLLENLTDPRDLMFVISESEILKQLADDYVCMDMVEI